MLGDNILGRGFKFDIELVEGAGAFVCGEETALIASLEGEAGRPRPRPPFPAQKGLVGQAQQHQQRRDLVQHRAHRHQGPGLVHRNRQRQEFRNQGLLAGRQGAQQRVGRDAAGHAAEDVYLRHRRRRRGWPQHQVGADRRSVRRLHPARDVRHAGGLRKPGATGLHHGLGRHGGDGRRQLHGRRRPLLRGVHQLRVVRQVRSLPRRPEQVPAHPEPHHARRRPHAAHGDAGRPEPLHSRLLVMRAGPDGAQSGADHDAPLPPGVRGPHRGPALPGGRLHRTGAFALREQLPAAHEHSALPAALQGGPAGGGVRIGDPGQPSALLPPDGCASIPATSAAAARPWTTR